jgi:hypothetical protein
MSQEDAWIDECSCERDQGRGKGIHTNFDTSLVADISERTQCITRVVTAELLDLGLRVLGLADGLQVGWVFILAVAVLALKFHTSCTILLGATWAGDVGVVWVYTHLIAPNKQPGTAAEESFAIATKARKKVALENILEVCRSTSYSKVFVRAVGKCLVSRIPVKQLNCGRRGRKGGRTDYATEEGSWIMSKESTVSGLEKNGCCKE